MSLCAECGQREAYRRLKLCNVCRYRVRRKYHLKTKYGITPEFYDALLEKQSGCCAICNTHQSELERALAIDLNYETGKVRGLLCLSCKWALGLFSENIHILNMATKYVAGR